MKWVNYKEQPTKTIPAKPLERETACKLDSKARLVLPLHIRDSLNVSYGDCVSMQVVGKNGSSLLLKINSMQAPAEGTQGKKFFKTSKNAWESKR